MFILQSLLLNWNTLITRSGSSLSILSNKTCMVSEGEVKLCDEHFFRAIYNWHISGCSWTQFVVIFWYCARNLWQTQVPNGRTLGTYRYLFLKQYVKMFDDYSI